MAILMARSGLSMASRRPSQAVFRCLSTATSSHTPLGKPQAQPHHASHVHKAHLAHGTIAVTKYHTKPEVRQADLLKMGRDMMPEFLASAPGVWGLPGPRSFFFENHHNEWTSVGLWESSNAMEAFKKSPAHDKIMQKFGALIDVGKVDEHVCHADFHYFEPMRQCNWERYPVEVVELKVKPGFRKHLQKLVVDNSPFAAFCNTHGAVFQVLVYNAAEDHVVFYTVFRDLLKWEAAQGELEKNIADWGLADFLEKDVETKQHAKQDAHNHIHNFERGAIHSNAWVFSQ